MAAEDVEMSEMGDVMMDASDAYTDSLVGGRTHDPPIDFLRSSPASEHGRIWSGSTSNGSSGASSVIGGKHHGGYGVARQATTDSDSNSSTADRGLTSCASNSSERDVTGGGFVSSSSVSASTSPSHSMPHVSPRNSVSDPRGDQWGTFARMDNDPDGGRPAAGRHELLQAQRQESAGARSSSSGGVSPH